MGGESAAVAEIDSWLLVVGLLVGLVLIVVVFAWYSTQQKRRARQSQRARYKRNRPTPPASGDDVQR